MSLHRQVRFRHRIAAGLLAALVIAAGATARAGASEQHPTLLELEGEVMCPTCHTTLDQSNSLEAQRIEAFISRRIRIGDTKREIKAKLVTQFGEGILAAPAWREFDLLAWLLPIGGAVAGGAALALGAWRWSRFRASQQPGSVEAGPLEPELERRLDEELARYS